MSKYYVLLTGDKENAGDFLIRDSAEHLLRHARPDRQVKVLPAWKPLDAEALDIVNSAEALILCGGPSLRPAMWPKIYPLTTSLDSIRTPIATLGVGWKGFIDERESSYARRFTEQARLLLNRVQRDGYGFSVRDPQSAQVLRDLGADGIHLTGCPVLFRQVVLSGAPPSRTSPADDYYVFSPGAVMGESRALEKQARGVVSLLKEQLPGRCVVAFHHRLGYGTAQTTGKGLQGAQESLRAWLVQAGVDYQELAGGHERMAALYAGARLHVGYRVHAHLLCSASGIPSLLLSEDGRGVGAANALKEDDSRAFVPRLSNAYVQAGMSRLGLMDWNIRAKQAASIVHSLQNINLERKGQAIIGLWNTMKGFVEKLP